MKLTILLFASVQDEWQSPSVDIELPEGATAQSLLDHLISLKPSLEAKRASLRVAVDQQFCSASTLLSEGQEIAIIPPVSGG